MAISQKVLAWSDGFWAINFSGEILLLDKNHFREITSVLESKYGDDLIMFKLCLTAFSRMDYQRHSEIENDIINVARAYYHKNPSRIPTYSLEGRRAALASEAFLTAVFASASAKEAFELEEIQIENVEHWLIYQYRKQGPIERLLKKRRLLKKIVITPSNITKITGNSFDFEIFAKGCVFKVSSSNIIECLAD